MESNYIPTGLWAEKDSLSVPWPVAGFCDNYARGAGSVVVRRAGGLLQDLSEGLLIKNIGDHIVSPHEISMRIENIITLTIFR